MTTPFSMFNPLFSPNVVKLKAAKDFSQVDWIYIQNVTPNGTKYKVRLMPCDDLDLEHLLRTTSEFYEALTAGRFGNALFMNPTVAATLFMQLLYGPARERFQGVRDRYQLPANPNMNQFNDMINQFMLQVMSPSSRAEQKAYLLYAGLTKPRGMKVLDVLGRIQFINRLSRVMPHSMNLPILTDAEVKESFFNAMPYSYKSLYVKANLPTLAAQGADLELLKGYFVNLETLRVPEIDNPNPQAPRVPSISRNAYAPPRRSGPNFYGPPQPSYGSRQPFGPPRGNPPTVHSNPFHPTRNFNGFGRPQNNFPRSSNYANRGYGNRGSGNYSGNRQGHNFAARQNSSNANTQSNASSSTPRSSSYFSQALASQRQRAPKAPPQGAHNRPPSQDVRFHDDFNPQVPSDPSHFDDFYYQGPELNYHQEPVMPPDEPSFEDFQQPLQLPQQDAEMNINDFAELNINEFEVPQEVAQSEPQEDVHHLDHLDLF